MHYVAIDVREYKETSSRTSVRAGKPWGSVAEAFHHHGPPGRGSYKSQRLMIIQFQDEGLRRFLRREPDDKDLLVTQVLDQVLATDQVQRVDPLPIVRKLRPATWKSLGDALGPTLPACRAAHVRQRRLEQSICQLLLDTNHAAGRAMCSKRWPNQWVRTHRVNTPGKQAVADRQCQIRLLRWRIEMRRWPLLKNDIGQWQAAAD